jgi:integrase/recombinase XerD
MLDGFIKYLDSEKHMAKNSLDAYKHDVNDFSNYLASKGVDDLMEATNTEVVSFLLYLKEKDRSASTINRKLASVRAYYTYLVEKGKVNTNPTANIKSPKVERKDIEYLTIEETDKLLAAPDDSVKGKRDRAILELLYATGIRVNEVVAANMSDLNLRIGFFTCPGESGKARIVPIGRPARAALEEYIYSARNAYLKGENDDEQALFLNHRGQRMTRQGLWKILKEYGKKADLEKIITPHIIRNSFAVHMVQNGADLKSLKELMGHEDLAATQIYLSVTKNRIKDVYDKTHPRA